MKSIKHDLPKEGTYMRILHNLGAVIVALFSIVLIMGCNNQPKPDVTISSVVIESAQLQEPLEMTTFELSDILLTVIYSDGSRSSIPLSASMLSSPDLLKLNVIGTHQITVTYQDFNTSFTITLKNQAVTDLLMTYYEFAVEHLEFTGDYDAWLSSLIQGRPITIINAQMNEQNELIITFSNQETLNLGKTSTPVIYNVQFYGFYGEILATIMVAAGGSATAPIPPEINNYQFIGWDQAFNQVTSNLNVYAMYQMTGTLVEFDDADRLLISIDRLENAQFSINLDAIFSNSSSSQQSQRQQLLSNLMYGSTLLNETNPYDLDNYIPHNYWRDMYFHKNLYQQPDIIDGYYVITSTLSAFNDHALNNLYTVTEQVTQSAKERADWAVDHITVVDTWVISENYKYLLHYNEALDRVELYTIWTYEPHAVTSYEKIYVYFNSEGEEVIESWIEQIYTTTEYPGVMVYHNSVGARDFNYYAIWLDENYEPKANPHFRGVNLNDDGYYEYYDNHYHMISGNYGWYTISPSINMEDGTFKYSENPHIQVYSPDASSNVISISSGNQGLFMVMLYLPSMNGVESLLISEGSMIEVNQDSYHSQQIILEAGLSLMPDWWMIDPDKQYDPEYPNGFKTSKGTFISSPYHTEEVVNFRYLTLNVGREGVRQYDHLHNYYAVAHLYFYVDTFEELTQALTQYLHDVGLTYKYGDTQRLFNEINDVLQNYETIGRDISIINDTLPGPKDTYSDFENVMDTYAFLTEYLNIRFDLMDMVNNFSEIEMHNMPSKDDLSRISLIDTSSMLQGTITYENEQIKTDNLTGILRRSPLLQHNQNYTLIYAMMIGGRLIELGREEQQTYLGDNLNFSGTQTIDIPKELFVGTYTLVVYYAKVTPNGLLRISSVVPWEVEPFETDNIVETDEETELARNIEIKHDQSTLVINVTQLDLYPPKVKIMGNQIYQGVVTLDSLLIPFGSHVIDLIGMMQIFDNTDGFIDAQLIHVLKDGHPVALDDEITGTGWEIIISDQAGNTTQITINHIEYGYKVTFMVLESVYFETIVLPGETVDLPLDPVIIGQTFINWDTDNFEINETRIIHAIYEVNNYQITWIYGDQVIQVDEQIPYNTQIIRPIMEEIIGYRFVWDLTKTTMPAHDLVVTGNYIRNIYYAYFMIDGQFYAAQSYHYGDVIDYPVPVAPEGYVFSGWSVSDETMPDQNLMIEGTFIPAS